MNQLTSSSTAWLSVTSLVNERWSMRSSARSLSGTAHAAEEILCSDAISLRPHQLADPEFDAAGFVMDSALMHTEQYCAQKQVRIEEFKSVEVLRFAEPVNGVISFLFVMEPAASA